MDEVVVVGYGTQKRLELTSSISTVNKDLLNQSVGSVENALQGAVASTSTGASGSDAALDPLSFLNPSDTAYLQCRRFL